MARLRQSRPPGLRARIVDELVALYGPPHDRHPFDDGLMWNVRVEKQVTDLLAGGRVEMWDFDIPRDLRTTRGFNRCTRVALTGEDTLTVLPDTTQSRQEARNGR